MGKLINWLQDRCILFHAWGKWYRGEGIYYSSIEHKDIKCSIQARDCVRCGYHQVRRIR